jgi:hypothetical protein
MAHDCRLEQALLHPSIQAAAELVAQIGVRLTAATVRARMMAMPAFPALGLAEILEAFDAWRSPAAVFRADPGTIRSLPLPLLTMLAERDASRGTGGEVPVIVTAWLEDAVAIRHPVRGDEQIEWRDFLDRWSGLFLAARADPAAAEPDFDAKQAAERESAAAYRRSIALIDGFMDAAECAAMSEACERGGLFQRSPVADWTARNPVNYMSDQRTSSTAVLPPPGAGAHDFLYARAAARLGVDPGWIERLQCVRYEPGERFRPHMDGSGRTHTLLVYLNDDFEGGETLFPDLDLRIRPRRGTALLFANLDTAGAPIAWSRHGGEPPRGGRKYACNIWAHAAPVTTADDSARAGRASARG